MYGRIVSLVDSGRDNEAVLLVRDWLNVRPKRVLYRPGDGRAAVTIPYEIVYELEDKRPSGPWSTWDWPSVADRFAEAQREQLGPGILARLDYARPGKGPQGHVWRYLPRITQQASLLAVWSCIRNRKFRDIDPERSAGWIIAWVNGAGYRQGWLDRWARKLYRDEHTQIIGPVPPGLRRAITGRDTHVPTIPTADNLRIPRGRARELYEAWIDRWSEALDATGLFDVARELWPGEEWKRRREYAVRAIHTAARLRTMFRPEAGEDLHCGPDRDDTQRLKWPTPEGWTAAVSFTYDSPAAYAFYVLGSRTLPPLGARPKGKPSSRQRERFRQWQGISRPELYAWITGDYTPPALGYWNRETWRSGGVHFGQSEDEQLSARRDPLHVADPDRTVGDEWHETQRSGEAHELRRIVDPGDEDDTKWPKPGISLGRDWLAIRERQLAEERARLEKKNASGWRFEDGVETWRAGVVGTAEYWSVLKAQSLRRRRILETAPLRPIAPAVQWGELPTVARVWRPEPVRLSTTAVDMSGEWWSLPWLKCGPSRLPMHVYETRDLEHRPVEPCDPFSAPVGSSWCSESYRQKEAVALQGV